MAPKMKPFVFTDFSGLEPLSTTFCRSHSSFFVETPVIILPPTIDVPITGITHNGQPVQFAAHFERRETGFIADIAVESVESEPSSKFAEFYLNLMLDVASLRHASPFQILMNSGEDKKRIIPSTSGIMQQEDFDQAARIAFLYYTWENDLTRSISWYRKGLSSPDPLLSFLGLWNSIEILASKFCEKNAKTEGDGKTKNQIHQAFLDYLKESRSEFFADDDEMHEWIKENHKMRLDIAHGLASSDLNTYRRNEVLIPKIRKIATTFVRLVADARRTENEKMKCIIEQANQQAAQRRKEATEAARKTNVEDQQSR